MAAFGTRSLVLRLATVAAPTAFADYTASVSNVTVKSASADRDFVSFADAAAGGARDYVLALTLVQDNATTALHYKIWNETGQDVPYEVWPNGRPVSGTASATQPKYSGLCTISEPDGDLIGGDADASTTQRFTSDVEWALTAKPTLTVS